jgi:hypothetical protein
MGLERENQNLRDEIARLRRELEYADNRKRQDERDHVRIFAAFAMVGLIQKVPLVDRDKAATFEEGRAACRTMRADVVGSAYDYAFAALAEEQWRYDQTGDVPKPNGVVEFEAHDKKAAE